MTNDTAIKHQHCPNCKSNIDWDRGVWSISTVKGYKTKEHVCECGQHSAILVTVTKEAHEKWKQILS